jgi:hypothetical protein
MRKVDHHFFLKNYIKGDRRTLLNAWGETMLDHRMLHQNWTTTLSQDAFA